MMMLRGSVLVLAAAFVAAKSAACEEGACEETEVKSTALLQQSRQDSKADVEQPAGCYLKGSKFEPINMPGQGRTVEKSAMGCQNRCASVTGCAHFSWWPNGGCHLQDAASTWKSDRSPVAGSPICTTTTTTTEVPIIPVVVNASDADQISVKLTIVK